MKTSKLFLFFAALFGLLAVIAGAFGAHILEKNLNTQLLQRLHTGVEYQFYHTAALFGVGILSSLHRNYSSRLLKLSGFCFILGILLFSGSLYAYALTGDVKFGMITPFGGISFMLGWLFLLIYPLTKKKHSE
jgi:uncharacterized membrane protein YgdD (TMEM256/DUF423 family)